MNAGGVDLGLAVSLSGKQIPFSDRDSELSDVQLNNSEATHLRTICGSQWMLALKLTGGERQHPLATANGSVIELFR